MESDPLRPVGDLSELVDPPVEPRPHYDRPTVLDGDGKTTVRIPVDPGSIVELVFVDVDGTGTSPTSSSITSDRSIAVVELELEGSPDRPGIVRAVLET